MKSEVLNKATWLQVVFLIVSVAALPLAAQRSLAATSEPPASGKSDAPSAFVLSDQKKVAAKPQNPESQKGDAAVETSAAGGEEREVQPVSGDEAARETESDDPAEKKGMSTMTKIGIGVGAAAVVGLGLALAGGAGSDGDDGPVLPKAENLVGKWNARATSHTDKRTYTGVYDLYAVGSHTYDIYITGDEVRKRGRGSWTLVEGTTTLRLENDTGSIYIGDFQNEDFTTITLSNQFDRWELVMTRQ